MYTLYALLVDAPVIAADNQNYESARAAVILQERRFRCQASYDSLSVQWAVKKAIGDTDRNFGDRGDRAHTHTLYPSI